MPAGTDGPGGRRDARRAGPAALLILGASARAAAQSATRAGFRPAAADLFADLDLTAIAPATRRVDRSAYPDGLAALAASAPPSPWLYTGALENHPGLVDRIARVRDRPLWGNPGPVLRAVRDPIAVAAALGRAGLACPAVRLDPFGLPRDGSWLVKPRASAGGRRVRPLRAGDPAPRAPSYYQEWIAGPSLAAIFAGATLLGVSRQWIGGAGASSDFAYRGSLGPWPLAAPERAGVEQLGRALAAAFGLAGLFGVDFILKDGIPWPVEINPRYTASVEVLELALGRPFLVDHARAFDPEGAGRLRPISPPPVLPAFVGKAFLFAPAACRFPERSPARVRAAIGFEVPRCADIPAAGRRFEAGEPVLTVFARGSTADACWRRLQRRLAAWTRRLEQAGPG